MKSLGEEIDEGVQAWRDAKPEARRMVREAAIASLVNRNVVGAAEMFDDSVARARGPEARREHISEVLARELARMEDPQRGIQMPFPLLSHLLVGSPLPGEFMVIGARPGVGKSTLGVEITRYAAKAGHRVLYVSREMLSTALARRALAQEGRLSASRLKLGTEDPAAVARVAERLAGLPVWLSDTASSIEQIDSVCDDVDLVIVDYLQLVTAPKGVRERHQQVSHNSRSLKKLATDRRIPVIALSSLRRPDGAANPEPIVADLKESGDIDHDADVIVLMHRPDPDVPEVVLIVAKNRDGETGRLKLAFKGEIVSFFAMETRYGDEA